MKKNGCPTGEILVREKCIPKDKAQPGSELIVPIHRLTLEERKLQKKTASYLHKTLNKKGIKVQFKGGNDVYNRAVIQLPAGLWLLVSIEKGKPNYTIGEDRCGRLTGCADKYYYDENKKLLMKELPGIIKKEQDKYLQDLGVVLKKSDVKKFLPRGYSIKDNITLYKEPGRKKKESAEYWAIAFCQKKKSNRLNKDDAKICLEALDAASGVSWSKDSVSNYIFHFIRIGRKPKLGRS